MPTAKPPVHRGAVADSRRLCFPRYDGIDRDENDFAVREGDAGRVGPERSVDGHRRRIGPVTRHRRLALWR